MAEFLKNRYEIDSTLKKENLVNDPDFLQILKMSLQLDKKIYEEEDLEALDIRWPINLDFDETIYEEEDFKLLGKDPPSDLKFD
jgi:hypothetical protein